MALDLIIHDALVNKEEELVDIGISNGQIVKIQKHLSDDANRHLFASGRVVIPGLIESHIHPDKAFLEEKMPNLSGTLEEALKNTMALKSTYTFDDVYARASRLLDWAVTRGTTVMRAHPDVDPVEGLIGVETILRLKEEYRNLIDLQIVAFPQEGIFNAGETASLLEQALKEGADVVGGCPYGEDTIGETYRHVDFCFELAERYGKPIDMHVDFSDELNDPRHTMTEYIAEKTIEYGMQGRVTLGHAITLGVMPYDRRMMIFEKLAKADITIVILPSTDLHLSARGEKEKPWRGLAPLKDLLKSGVNVTYSSNNIRNGFTPFGLADMIQIGLLLANTAHMGTAKELVQILDMATYNGAKNLGMSESYGIRVGAQADLIILDTYRFEDVIIDQPERLYVVKRGRVTVSTQKSIIMEQPKVATGPNKKS